MGRKINSSRKRAVIRTVEENNDQLKAGGIARELDLHRQEVVRILTSLEDEPVKYLYEDDQGHLGIVRRK